jgi:LmbE family N-acetylglucosaminyl deacetylase
MYTRIASIYHAFRQSRKLSLKQRIFGGMLLLLSIIALLSMAYNNSRAKSLVQPQDLPLLELDHAQRLLVISPHPDDETLGAGGAIQAAVARGMQVRVIVFTNGDGQPAAPLLVEKKLIPNSQAFVRMGQMRQQESLNALQILGVPAEDVYFLGFPDRELDKLWLDNWQNQCPLRGDFTRATQVPYPDVYVPGASYCGSTLLEIVKGLLNDYRPDLILLPHLSDNHPDHRAASQFTLLTVAEMTADDPAYSPTIMSYIIHFGKYPRIQGWHLRNSLLPPIPLIWKDDIWRRLDLPSNQELIKAQAIRAYASQFKMMKSFLEGFARQDEIFQRVDLLEFPSSWLGSVEINQVEDLQLSKTDEAVKDSTRRRMLPGTDLVDLQASILGGQLQVAASARGTLIPDLRYLINFKFTDGTTKTCLLSQDGVRLDPVSYACTLNVSYLHPPAVIGFQAEVSEKLVLDRSEWHFLILR